MKNYFKNTVSYLKVNAAPLLLGVAIAILLVFIYRRIVGCSCGKSSKNNNTSLKLPGAEIDVKLPKSENDD